MSSSFIQDPPTFTKSVSTGTYKTTHFKISHNMQLYKKLVRATCLSWQSSVCIYIFYLYEYSDSLFNTRFMGSDHGTM